MTHLTEENLNKICDYLIDDANYRAAAASVGISELAFYNWRTRCQQDRKKNDTTSPFYICRGGEWQWWDAAVEQSRREFFLSYEATVRGQAKSGIVVPVRGPTQEVIFRKDPRFIGRSDSHIREVLGMGDWEPVEEWHRYLKDDDGHPVPEVKVEQIPAQLRLRVLEAADPRYRPTSHQSVDVNLQGSVVHTAAPLQRKPNEPRADLAELRALAKLSPEERRKQFGATAHPMDKAGRRQIPKLSPPVVERSDHPQEQPYIAPPNAPQPYTPPPKPPVSDPGVPSYAKPSKNLDTGERIGHGDPPPGGMRVA